MLSTRCTSRRCPGIRRNGGFEQKGCGNLNRHQSLPKTSFGWFARLAECSCGPPFTPLLVAKLGGNIQSLPFLELIREPTREKTLNDILCGFCNAFHHGCQRGIAFALQP